MTLTEQHYVDKIAAGLLIFGSIAATIINYFTNQGFWNPGYSHTGLIALILFQPVYVLIVYYIWKGKRWAKILFIVLCTPGFLALLFDSKRVTAIAFTSPGAVANFIAQTTLSVSVVILLILTLRRPTSEAR
ncbi:MAG: hypothetical protein ACRYF0_09435 [Janthinobacterium lividum]